MTDFISQVNSRTEDKKISRKTGKPVTSWGGKREGAGRKSRMTEHEIIERLEPMAETAFRILHEISKPYKFTCSISLVFQLKK
jgi:hypothetical protein